MIISDECSRLEVLGIEGMIMIEVVMVEECKLCKKNFVR